PGNGDAGTAGRFYLGAAVSRRRPTQTRVPASSPVLRTSEELATDPDVAAARGADRLLLPWPPSPETATPESQGDSISAPPFPGVGRRKQGCQLLRPFFERAKNWPPIRTSPLPAAPTGSCFPGLQARKRRRRNRRAILSRRRRFQASADANKGASFFARSSNERRTGHRSGRRRCPRRRPALASLASKPGNGDAGIAGRFYLGAAVSRRRPTQTR